MNITPEQIQQGIEVGVMIVGVASMLSPFIPNPTKYNAALIIAKRILDILAFNFRNARNEQQPPKL